jgi:hypothetical protein
MRPNFTDGIEANGGIQPVISDQIKPPLKPKQQRVFCG